MFALGVYAFSPQNFPPHFSSPQFSRAKLARAALSEWLSAPDTIIFAIQTIMSAAGPILGKIACAVLELNVIPQLQALLETFSEPFSSDEKKIYLLSANAETTCAKISSIPIPSASVSPLCILQYIRASSHFSPLRTNPCFIKMQV